MRQSQSHAFEGYMGSDESSGISFPHFEALADAHGIPYLRMNDNVRAYVKEALRGSWPALVEVAMDPEQDTIPKSINRRVDGQIVQTPIEDAWPFLDREELEENLRV